MASKITITNKGSYSQEDLNYIWHQVPPDYYQKGIRKNFLQRLWHRGKLSSVLQLADGNNMFVLDIGCASGWFLNQLSIKYPFAKCYGIDVYRNAIQYGKKHYKSLDLAVADAHKLPFSNDYFDLVICTEVLEHVKNPEKVLREIKRVLRPDGKAIVEMDSGNFLFRAIWYWWTNMRKGVWRESHIHFFNAKILENMIKDLGFVIAQKKVFNVTMAVAFLLRKNEKNN